jgi:hypothetical protein
MSSDSFDVNKKLTANQLFKIYKDDGGTLNFSDWLTREKTKGVFPLNSNLNEEINISLSKLEKEKVMKGTTVLGFPLKTIYIAGGVIVLAIIVGQIIKKK